jgi:hypothetical protein
MDRTGKRRMGCLDDEYKLIAIIVAPRMSYCPRSWRPTFLLPVLRYVVTLRLLKRRVAMCPSDTRRNGASPLAWRSPPGLAHSMLRLLGVSEA